MSECKYCSGDVDTRNYLISSGSEGVYIDGNNNLTADDEFAFEDLKIKCCPVCGRRLEGSQMDRNYVVVCNRYRGIGGSLLFWGTKTEDDSQRSFGGYTSDFNNCERYTLEEIEDSGYKFPVYGKDINHDNFRTVEDFAIEIKRLERLGHRPVLIYYK